MAKALRRFGLTVGDRVAGGRPDRSAGALNASAIRPADHPSSLPTGSTAKAALAQAVRMQPITPPLPRVPQQFTGFAQFERRGTDAIAGGVHRIGGSSHGAILFLQLLALLPSSRDHGIGRNGTLRLPEVFEHAAERLKVVATLTDFAGEPLRIRFSPILLLRNNNQRPTPIFFQRANAANSDRQRH